jgi:membrane protein DedA with SNARE-associated domain
MKELIHQYGAWIVFALVFLESIGLPLPGEAILVSAAIFAGTTQELSIVLVLFAAIIGAILGSIIGFWIGDRYGYPLLLRYGSYIGLTETRIKIAQYLFRRQGIIVVLIARFVAVMRSVVGFIAGANRMPFTNFMIANSAGAAGWALFYGLGAYYLGKGVEEFAKPFALALALIAAIVIVSAIIYWRRIERQLADAAERDIPGPLRVD